ncbi:microtubule-associated proteins 1A/1B light chain 3C-like [Symsagittifera roscoffensis]|uniref:microtubule-associated proteins 1A/1B light chain 3C-like n=1 Tax=Symsagittifera roscoffensis TaxID=84072 RepID=UPI00307C70C8
MPDERGIKTFKERKTFAQRKEEASGIRAKFPQKVPVIVEKYHKEKSLPALDKTKFLVPQEITMSQFVTIIRNRMSLSSTQAFYLIVNNKSIASMSTTLSELYRDERDADGFLYMTYASHEMFGALESKSGSHTTDDDHSRSLVQQPSSKFSSSGTNSFNEQ